MKRFIASILLCTTLGLTLTACNKEQNITKQPVNTVIPEENTEEMNENNNNKSNENSGLSTVRIDGTNLEKSIDVADKIYEKTNANTMFSPTSLNFALGLLYEGADENTPSKKALTSYLGNDFSEKASLYMNDAIKEFNNKGDKNGYNTALEIANSVWVSDKYNIANNYKENVESKYQAQVDSIDTSNPDKSANKINSWCSDKTHELIDKIVSPDTINSDTTAILVNSVYFESPWAKDWYTNPEQEREIFNNLDGTQSEVVTIHNSDGTYFENDKARAFGMGYMSGMEFIGILPNQEGDFNLSDLDIPNLITNIKENTTAKVSMPKLNFETDADLTNILNNEELQYIFKDSKDFVHMYEEEIDTKVSSIIQKTKLELDKYGTKAAAVTAISIEKCAIAPVMNVEEIHLDRPFAFVIYDRYNDEVLFVGKVTNL